MKILVSGASGGLGRLVIEQLLKKKHTVIATSRDPEKAKKLEFYNQVIYRPCNIEAPPKENLFEYFDKPDLFIHLAWEKLNEYKNPAHLNEILSSHKAFLNTILSDGLRDLTVAGTCYEYGLYEGELNENMQAQPVMPYPEAKNLLRLYLEEIQKSRAFSLKWLRIFYVFGEIKERKNLYTLLMQAIANGDKTFNMSGGEQVRDFLSPAQVAGIICDAACQQSVEGIINCCSGQPVKLKEFIKKFLNENNLNIELNLGHYPYPDYEPMLTWGSRLKLNRIYSNLQS